MNMIHCLTTNVNTPEEKDITLEEALRVLSRILEQIEKIGRPKRP